MIKQTAFSDVNSRSECNVYLNNGFLPLITAPMNSVIDENNYQVFLDNKINICLPRNVSYNGELNDHQAGVCFSSCSLDEFIEVYINGYDPFDSHQQEQICIDTAQGGMSKLHNAIRKAKELRGDSLIIMAGNVSTVDSFERLAWSGCDFIRTGVGSGGGCTTTKNTGVGQLDLEYLITDITKYKQRLANKIDDKSKLTCKTKIVADGISSHLQKCQVTYGFNDNGYAAINKLLWVGADLVMVGTLFAQSFESAGEKRTAPQGLEVLMSGMSTHTEQQTYRDNLRHSEGSSTWIPVRFSLRDWILGNSSQDVYPFLSGFIPCLQSAMSYCNSFNLKDFKE